MTVEQEGFLLGIDMQVFEELSRARKAKRRVYASCIDFSNAYNTINRNLLMERVKGKRYWWDGNCSCGSSCCAGCVVRLEG